MRVALLGGGGFRTPLAFEAVRRAFRIDDLVLHDVDEARIAHVATVLAGMMRGGPRVSVRSTTSLEDAVDGADFVLCAIRVGGVRGRVVDEEVPLELGLLGQETVGPGGIAFALRTVPEMLRIAEVVAERAPDAWFVNFTNPAGLVTEALRRVLGERVVGVCDSPSALTRRVARALLREPGELRFEYAGLNHLGWLLAVRDGDADLLPALLADDAVAGTIDEVRLFGLDRVRAEGVIPNEYLVYYERPGEIAAAFRRSRPRGAFLAEQQERFFASRPGTPEQALAAWRRAVHERHGTYMAEVHGGPTSVPSGRSADPPALTEDDFGYAGVAASFMRAIAGGERREQILDVANHGVLDGLDDDAVVEVTCEVGPDGVRRVPTRARLGDDRTAMLVRMKQVERLTIDAATRGSADLALEALAAHPLVPTRDLAGRLLEGYLQRHDSLARLLR